MMEPYFSKKRNTGNRVYQMCFGTNILNVLFPQCMIKSSHCNQCFRYVEQDLCYQNKTFKFQMTPRLLTVSNKTSRHYTPF